MSATAFQRIRREAEAKRLAEAEMKKAEDAKATEPTNKELMAMLDELGIKYDKRANKETLKALLDATQNKDAGDDNDQEDQDNDDEGAD